MADCKKCRFRSVCKKRPKMEGATIEECDLFRNDIERTEPMTNADRIRAMSDEELAKEFADCAIGLYCDTRKKWLPELPENVKRKVFDSLLEWLKQPAKEGE